jgi:hypothetical protein
LSTRECPAPPLSGHVLVPRGQVGIFHHPSEHPKQLIHVLFCDVSSKLFKLDFLIVGESQEEEE